MEADEQEHLESLGGKTYLCKVCNKNENSKLYLDGQAMLDAGMCFICFFWHKYAIAGNGLVTKTYAHYLMGPDNTSNPQYNGHGGHLFCMKHLATGEIFSSANLWYQGEIPTYLRKWFVPNMEFTDSSGKVDERLRVLGM